MRISDWSSDVCSSDLHDAAPAPACHSGQIVPRRAHPAHDVELKQAQPVLVGNGGDVVDAAILANMSGPDIVDEDVSVRRRGDQRRYAFGRRHVRGDASDVGIRSEEHTSELQSLMRISYAVFCLKKKKHNI